VAPQACASACVFAHEHHGGGDASSCAAHSDEFFPFLPHHVPYNASSTDPFVFRYYNKHEARSARGAARGATPPAAKGPTESAHARWRRCARAAARAAPLRAPARAGASTGATTRGAHARGRMPPRAAS
jgi:hypothetical protein